MEKQKQGRPALVEVYCVVGWAETSKGRIHHGDRVKVPREEAERLKAEGKVK